MLPEIDIQIAEVRQKVRLKETMTAMRVQMVEHLLVEKSRLGRLVEILERERLDVDRLERFTLARLIGTVAGTLDGNLRKEREEYLEALIKYEEAADSVVQLEEDLERMVDELRGLETIETDYARLIEKKEHQLSENSHSLGSEFESLAERIEQLTNEITQLRQIVIAAEQSEEALERVTIPLAAAQSMARLDMLSDGGAMMPASKISRLNAARSEVREAQRHLTLLQDRLAGIDQRLIADLANASLYSFADLFFDSLLSDYLVERRISCAMNTCREMRVEVRRVHTECHAKLKQLEKELAPLVAERNDWIEKAKI